MTSTRKNIGISETLLKYLKNEASEKEIADVEMWLRNEENHRYFETLKNSNLISENLVRMSKIDVETHFYAFRKKRNRQRNVRQRLVFYKVAASVFILLSLGFAFYWLNQPDAKAHLAEEIVNPGSNKAYLFISSGEKIVLDGKHSGRVIEEKTGTKIRANKDSLVYKTDDVSVEETVFNTIVVPRNGEYYLCLSDGTKVWLNADTRLKFPIHFPGNMREVYLQGEAYFEVRENKKCPFIVKTALSNIKVLGTGFNVKAYKNELHSTTLVHGKVEVADNNNNKALLKPNEQAVLINKQIKVNKVETARFTAWKEGYFWFHETTLDEILKQLSRWYDFEYAYQDQEIAHLKLTTKLRKFDDFKAIMQIMEETNLIELKLKERTLMVNSK